MAKIKYYDIKNILSTNANYMLLLGQRANGKSYQSKITALKSAIAGEGKFIYLRRWQADIKVKAVESYFSDMDISKLTNGEYTQIIAYSNTIYLGFLDEKGKLCKGKEIGMYCALNEAERYKSWAFVDFKYIIFEEFITDMIYLDEEPRLLQQFVSTVARNKKMHIIMVGNTLSRVCPYFSEWALDGVLRQKQGTIEIYHFHTAGETIDIAVEYCANANATNKMFFGQSAKQIVSGEWDTIDLPRLPQPKFYYEKVYEILIEYQTFRFCLELLVDENTGGTICYVYPQTNKTKKFDRIITDKFSDSPYITNQLLNRRPENIIDSCLRLNKICYSDNLTGTDFKHVLDYLSI